MLFLNQIFKQNLIKALSQTCSLLFILWLALYCWPNASFIIHLIMSYINSNRILLRFDKFLSILTLRISRSTFKIIKFLFIYLLSFPFQILPPLKPWTKSEKDHSPIIKNPLNLPNLFLIRLFKNKTIKIFTNPNNNSNLTINTWLWGFSNPKKLKFFANSISPIRKLHVNQLKQGKYQQLNLSKDKFSHLKIKIS